MKVEQISVFLENKAGRLAAAGDAGSVGSFLLNGSIFGSLMRCPQK